MPASIHLLKIDQIRRFNESLDEGERRLVLEWLRSLREIREGGGTRREMALAAIRVTVEIRVMQRLLGKVVRLAYDLGWRDRSWPARIGLAAVLGAAVTVGNQGAGIAAFGGAVGVPLWLVLGAGGTFVGTLIEELERYGAIHPRKSDNPDEQPITAA